MSTYLVSKVSNSGLDWGYEISDHAFVMINLHIGDDTSMGPGLTRVNSSVLNDPDNLSTVKSELTKMIGQMPCD